MIEISEELYPNLYYKLSDGSGEPYDTVEFCKKIENIEYDEFVEYHIYWNVIRPFERKQLITIKSYLSTQNLKNTKLILWSNVDLTNNEYLKPFLGLIEFRIFNVENEVIGTPLEQLKNKTLNDDKNYILGDLFRILILYKYGGVYVDMDMVFLRDLSPLLSQEFAYKWGVSERMINNAIIRIKKQSRLANDLINNLLLIEPGGTNWGAILFEKVREFNKDWTIFPCAFFDTEWTSDTTFENPYPFEPFKNIYTEYSMHSNLDGVFTWHWHGRWDEQIEIGSKWQILENKFNEYIKHKFKIEF